MAEGKGGKLNGLNLSLRDQIIIGEAMGDLIDAAALNGIDGAADETVQLIQEKLDEEFAARGANLSNEAALELARNLFTLTVRKIFPYIPREEVAKWSNAKRDFFEKFYKVDEDYEPEYTIEAARELKKGMDYFEDVDVIKSHVGATKGMGNYWDSFDDDQRLRAVAFLYGGAIKEMIDVFVEADNSLSGEINADVFYNFGERLTWGLIKMNAEEIISKKIVLDRMMDVARSFFGRKYFDLIGEMTDKNIN